MRKFIVIFTSQVSTWLIHLYRLLLKLEELGWGEELSRMYPCERSRIYYTLLNQEPHQVGNFPQGKIYVSVLPTSISLTFVKQYGHRTVTTYSKP